MKVAGEPSRSATTNARGEIRFSGEPFAEAVSIRLTPVGSADVVGTIVAEPDGSFQEELAWGEYEVALDAGGEAIFDPAVAVTQIGPGIGDEIGIVRNWGTSACIDSPDQDDQLLATGVDESIGFSGFDVRVDLPGWLPAGSRVAVTIQSDATWSGRVSLIDHAEDIVQEASESLGPVVGACVEGRVPIGASEVAVSSPEGEWVASVIMNVFGDPGPAGGGRVWVADDFEIDVPGS